MLTACRRDLPTMSGCSPSLTCRRYHHAVIGNIILELYCAQVSMDLIKQYTLPYLCFLGAGLIVVVYLAAVVLLILVFRLLFAPLRSSC